MNALHEAAMPSRAELMSGDDYRESLRGYRPRVYVDGRQVESVADEPSLRPGVNALAYTYDFARRAEVAPIALATQSRRNRVVSRMLHINESSGDLLNKLEAVRALCQETGCAQRYLAHDALNGIGQAVARIDDATGGTEHRARFEAYLAHAQDRDLSLGVAMTDAKGDRSLKPHQQPNPEAYVRGRAQRARHRHQRRQGHRDGRPVHARAAGHAQPQHGSRGRGLRGLLRGARGRARHHPGVASGRTPRRSWNTAMRCSRASTARPRPWCCSTGCSCPGSACSTRATGSTAMC